MKNESKVIKKRFVWAFLALNFLTTNIILAIVQGSYRYLWIGLGGLLLISLYGIVRTARDIAVEDFSTGIISIFALLFSAGMGYYLLINASIPLSFIIFSLIIIETAVVLMI